MMAMQMRSDVCIACSPADAGLLYSASTALDALKLSPDRGTLPSGLLHVVFKDGYAWVLLVCAAPLIHQVLQ